jgi:ribonuclease HII
MTENLLPGMGTENLITAGIDEAGRGCLAGPVVAGAVILPEDYDLPGLTDSKKLDEAARDRLAVEIKRQAVSWALGVTRAQVVDEINILQATFRAMGRSVLHLKVKPMLLMVDGNKTVPVRYLGNASGFRQEAVVKGDLKIPAISAASILAKTFRDKLMVQLERRYPGYGFAVHKGYGTKVHLQALKELGPCVLHRMTFKGVLPEKKKASRSVCVCPAFRFRTGR